MYVFAPDNGKSVYFADVPSSSADPRADSSANPNLRLRNLLFIHAQYIPALSHWLSINTAIKLCVVSHTSSVYDTRMYTWIYTQARRIYTGVLLRMATGDISGIKTAIVLGKN